MKFSGNPFHPRVARKRHHRIYANVMVQHAGFTLVEMVVVMAIIAVLAGMALPRMTGAWESAQLNESARQLYVSATWAKQYAVMARQRCRLVIDVTQGQYDFEHEVDSLREPGRFEPLRSEVIRARQLPSTVRFGDVRVGGETAGSRRVITFEPDGRASASVVVVTDGQRSYSLRVSPSTGRVQLMDGADRHPPMDRVDLDA